MNKQVFAKIAKEKKASKELKPILEYFKRDIAARIGLAQADVFSELKYIIDWILYRDAGTIDHKQNKGLVYWRISLKIMSAYWGLSAPVLKRKFERMKKAGLLFYASEPWKKGGKSFYIVFNVPLLLELLAFESIATWKAKELADPKYLKGILSILLDANQFNEKIFNTRRIGKSDKKTKIEISKKLNIKKTIIESFNDTESEDEFEDDELFVNINKYPKKKLTDKELDEMEERENAESES